MTIIKEVVPEILIPSAIRLRPDRKIYFGGEDFCQLVATYNDIEVFWLLDMAEQGSLDVFCKIEWGNVAPHLQSLYPDEIHDIRKNSPKKTAIFIDPTRLPLKTDGINEFIVKKTQADKLLIFKQKNLPNKRKKIILYRTDIISNCVLNEILPLVKAQLGSNNESSSKLAWQCFLRIKKCLEGKGFKCLFVESSNRDKSVLYYQKVQNQYDFSEDADEVNKTLAFKAFLKRFKESLLPYYLEQNQLT